MSNPIKMLKESQESLLTPFLPITLKTPEDPDSSEDKEKNPPSPEGPPPGWKPPSPEGPPPGWNPVSPEGPPPGWNPVSPEGPPPDIIPKLSQDVPIDVFEEEVKKHVATPYDKLKSSEKFDYLLKEFYQANPFIYSSMINHELEVRFGTKKKAFTKTEFDNVISKLKSFGFTTMNPSGDYTLKMQNEFLEANTGKFRQSDIRVELKGLFNIQEYCKTNDLKRLYQKDFSCINFQKKKLAKSSKGNLLFPADFYDFNFRVAYNTEEKIKDGIKQFIINNWSNTKKNFRLLNRVTFIHPDYPCKVDLSITKYSDKIMKKRKNKDQMEMITTYKVDDSNVFRNNEEFEIEIEIDNQMIGPSTNFDSVTKILTSLKKVIKFILSGLQGTNFPIPYSEQKEVLNSYSKMIWENDIPKYINTRSFIGPNSKTLQLINIASNEKAENINIRKDYVVTEKADGLRHLMYIAKDGKVYLIDTNMNVIFTGGKTVNKDCFNSLLDGELIACNKLGEFINLFAAFDIYYYQNKDIRALSFMKSENEKDIYQSRYQTLKLLTSTINLVSVLEIKGDKNIMDTIKNKPQLLSPIKLVSKQFYPYSKKDTIFQGCNEILTKVAENRFDYETDGLIFTHAYYGVGSDKIGHAGPKKRVRWDYSFKWKPSEFNTIDFLVTTLKNQNGSEIIKPIFEEGINVDIPDQLSTYKTVELRCGFNPKKDGYINPCQNIIDDKLPEYTTDTREDYVPMRFYPTDPYDINAGICKIMLKTDDTGVKQMFSEESEVFTDNTIVEFRYDKNREEEWRWIPLRVRHDKTDELRKGGTNFGNNYETANNNWKSIHNPITEQMIRSGENIPSAEVTEDKYYNTPSGSFQTQGMKNFHNLYVKRLLIGGVTKTGDKLIDLTCGKGGDMAKWIEAKLSFVFGIDYSKDNLENRINGACSRYLNAKKEFKTVPDCLFVHGNSGNNIKNGNALLNDKAKQISNAIFGIGKKNEELLGKGVYKQFGVGSNGFDVSSCQFAIHYFFQSPEILNGFLRNITECTKLNGYFIGTTYDGNTVFKMLSKVKTNESIKIMEQDKKIWEIQKIYGANTYTADSSCINYEIKVFQESIGHPISEFLVNFEYLQHVMEIYGFKIITNDEANDMGLVSGTGMFEQLFNQMQEKISQNKFERKNYGEAPNMTKTEKKISFLNRYFVFKKIREVNIESIQLELSEYTETQMELNKKTTDNSNKIVLDTSKPALLKKIPKKITLVQASDSSSTPPIKVPPKKTNKKTNKKKIIIEEE